MFCQNCHKLRVLKSVHTLSSTCRKLHHLVWYVTRSNYTLLTSTQGQVWVKWFLQPLVSKLLYLSKPTSQKACLLFALCLYHNAIVTSPMRLSWELLPNTHNPAATFSVGSTTFIKSAAAAHTILTCQVRFKNFATRLHNIGIRFFFRNFVFQQNQKTTCLALYYFYSFGMNNIILTTNTFRSHSEK